MFSTGDGYGYAGGYLWGLHALIMDNNNNNPYAPDYKFLYDPVTQKDWFDATHAYYHMNAVWDWWHKNVILKYAPSPPDHFYNNPPAATFVNVDGICDRGAFYSPNIKSLGEPGFEFANERSCPPSYSNEDFVIDSTVVRHEFTHAMMDWCGFHSQFGNGPGVNGEGYGWAMDEGNADWFAFLYDPKTTLLGDVVGRARDLDNTQMYPYNVNEPGSNMPEEHYTGQIWVGTFMTSTEFFERMPFNTSINRFPTLTVLAGGIAAIQISLMAFGPNPWRST